MEKLYTDEKNAQIVIALLKHHGIKRIVASPGATNVTFVRSVQIDSFFTVYSSVDERSAAYIACGMAAETGEPVVLSCTGATASRNYMPGLTEAFYRKLPVLVITSTQALNRIGHLVPQVIDRTNQPNDIVKYSVSLPIIKDEDDKWECELKVNNAILELKRQGGGPAHLNLPTIYTKTYTTKELPTVRKIERYTIIDNLPNLNVDRVAIFIGSHKPFSENETNIINEFCDKYNAVVFCDHTSSYKGRYRVLSSLIGCQHITDSLINCDLIIHIGEVSGDYYSLVTKGKRIWRLSPDGEIRDTFKKLDIVFEMDESTFFSHYNNQATRKTNEYIEACKIKYEELISKLPELPFSNIWVASKISTLIPENSTLHFGILNSLRSWNFFEIPATVVSACNVGGFGIDGGLSSLIGASLINNGKLYFGVIGDLAFFYDINVLGNRHVGNNLRILLINNGKGTEFKLNSHLASQFGEETDVFIAAAKHFGNKSVNLVKNFVSELGFKYISANNKIEFENNYNEFMNPQMMNKSIVFEVFTNSEDESEALELMMSIQTNRQNEAKKIARKLLGEELTGLLKKAIR